MARHAGFVMLGGGERDFRVFGLAAGILLVVLFSPLQVAVGAETYNIGDGGGWTTDTNYTDWANQYTFHEGDTIVFLYSRGSHDVLRVNQRDYLTCSASSPIETDASGETAFQLRAGGYYFICGFPDHCHHQQKVYIKVLPPLGIVPHPSVGGNLPVYSQSAEGPTATVSAPVVAPNAAAPRLQLCTRSLLMLILTTMSYMLCFTSGLQTV